MSAFMAMEERLMKAMGSLENRVSGVEVRISSLENSRTSNSRTPEGSETASNHEPLTFFSQISFS